MAFRLCQLGSKSRGGCQFEVLAGFLSLLILWMFNRGFLVRVYSQKFQTKKELLIESSGILSILIGSPLIFCSRMAKLMNSDVFS